VQQREALRASGCYLGARPIACLGAAVVITAFFTSTVTQQAVAYVSSRQPLLSGNASVARTATLSRSNGNAFHFANGDQLAFESSLLSAAYLGPDQKPPQVEPVCSTGDCDWPIYGSIGICAEVINITASSNTTLLEMAEEYIFYELRESGFQTIVQTTSSLVYTALIVPFPAPSHEFNDSLNTVAISEILVAFSTDPVNVTDNSVFSELQYLDVMFYFCTESFSSSVTGGIYNTLPVSSKVNILSSNTSTVNWMWNGQPGDEPCPNSAKGRLITLEEPTGLTNETYKIDVCTALLISNVFNLVVGGGILQESDRTIRLVVGQIATALGINLYGEAFTEVEIDPETQFQVVQKLADNLAASLTTLMQQLSGTYTGNNSAATGTAFAIQTAVHIRWYWLIYLGFQLVLTYIVLSCTIYLTYSSQVQVLKRSPLATMIALDKNARLQLGTIDSLDTLKDRAEKINVKLVRNRERRPLWLAMTSTN